jgi:hypothetical protein
MNKEPYKNFDLPTAHLDHSHDYVPAKTRDKDELERRHELPAGTLLLEQQQRGLVIAGEILEHVQDERDLDFALHILSMSAMNSAWYSYGRGADVMRRRLELPTIATVDNDWRQTNDGLLLRVRHGLAEAAGLANTLIYKKTRGLEMGRSTRTFGHTVGNIALEAACVPMIINPYVDPFMAQIQARERSLQLVEDARVVGQQIGSHVSLAQLADSDSPLSVEWRRQAPDGAYEALERAVEIAA